RNRFGRHISGPLYRGDQTIQLLLRLHGDRQSKPALEIGDNRMQRTRGMEGRALQPDDEMTIRSNPARKRRAQSRLADSRFARQQGDLTLPFAGGLPSLEQQ